jgi:hypothetical protein
LQIRDFRLIVMSKEKVGFTFNIENSNYKKAVELLNSIGVLKLAAINFKKIQ